MIARWLAMALVATAAFIATAADPRAAGSAPPARLLPVDEAARDPSFVKFRDELKAVIARKDAAALFTYIAPDIKIDFGGGHGALEFHKRWKPFNKDTKLWKALSLVVDNGGGFTSPDLFEAPYVSAAFPENVDVFEALVVTGRNVHLRAAPNRNAAILRRLDNDVLTIVKSASHPQHEAGPNDWSEVKDAGGNRGFVHDANLRSPIDYRATFQKRNGAWLMHSFLAGD
jgi:hypothetical protein